MAGAQPFTYELVRAPQQPPKKLIVILHGHGGDAETFVPTARTLQETIPDADIICLNGPLTVQLPPDSPRKNGSFEGRTWLKFDNFVDLAKISLRLIFNRIDVAQNVNRFADAELKKRGLTNDKLAFFGFSMGAGVALIAAQSRPEPCAAVVSHSGVCMWYPYVKSRPDTLIVIGDKDYIYEKTPDEKGIKGFLTRTFSYQHDATSNRLRALDMPLKEVVIPGLDHDINDESLAVAAAFLKEKLNAVRIVPAIRSTIVDPHNYR